MLVGVNSNDTHTMRTFHFHYASIHDLFVAYLDDEAGSLMIGIAIGFYITQICFKLNSVCIQV